MKKQDSSHCVKRAHTLSAQKQTYTLRRDGLLPPPSTICVAAVSELRLGRGFVPMDQLPPAAMPTAQLPLAEAQRKTHREACATPCPHDGPCCCFSSTASCEPHHARCPPSVSSRTDMLRPAQAYQRAWRLRRSARHKTSYSQHACKLRGEAARQPPVPVRMETRAV